MDRAYSVNTSDGDDVNYRTPNQQDPITGDSEQNTSEFRIRHQSFNPSALGAPVRLPAAAVNEEEKRRALLDQARKGLLHDLINNLRKQADTLDQDSWMYSRDRLPDFS
mmetsp:Transcript_28114/g.36840  ORF Transcript_28114/g.36840 Transcript_28114/m.36840 type:complete len:109 (-) Transcript_28114:482-808(-)